MSFLDQINPISIAEFEKYASGSVSNTNIKISTHTFRGDISQLIQAEVFIPIVSALQFTFDLCPYSFLTFLFQCFQETISFSSFKITGFNFTLFVYWWWCYFFELLCTCRGKVKSPLCSRLQCLAQQQSCNLHIWFLSFSLLMMN